MTKPRLYSLTVITTADRHIHGCQTLALDLAEAVQRAATHYGPIELNAQGHRSLPEPDRILLEGGTYIPSPYDHLLTPEQLNAFSAPTS